MSDCIELMDAEMCGKKTCMHSFIALSFISLEDSIE